ncbi:hypothetical protein AGABI2DRAFT_224678 [Agaricus bisporus var. bisporus H97]|uniref:hypothetical protein n=1 Tax=Agaricus bisporus var. bisporus (strain H97 / ATCC MYA-4626 / FGSC 10389) TaxID=936046 RepID=UPI00029F7A92|nr:hypothetical protein AGABI2DRAFT_224678 [Agaricus bisporus var. bisporus H97]EKV46164.1 hypothetical protein AGABI2DRAFT_224678 [Agaricus bisporus var. bisporus H97]
MRASLFLFLSLPVFILAQIQSDGANFLSPVTVAPGLDASVIFSNLTSPRGVAIDSQQNLLVVERGVGVSAFTRVSAGWSRTVVIKNDQLTHGIQIDSSTLYVSTASEVLAYSYDPATQVASSQGSALIANLPPDGELTTHTLQLARDNSGLVTAILVGSGPKTNIDITARDPASGRSQIRSFSLLTKQPWPLNWENGVVVAYGIRNPAGFAFVPSPQVGPVDSQTLLVVENAPSIDNVTGLTAAFANDNPADEIESVTISATGNTTPASYGFPDCATLWNGAADPTGVPQYKDSPRGTQFSLNLPSLSTPLPRLDPWCQNMTNNHPPAFNFQAHSVPLDIKRYEPEPIGVGGGLPGEWSGDVFVSFHGSFDRTPPTGYGVVHVPYPFGSLSTSPLGYDFLVQATDLNTCPGRCIRPAGLVFGRDNRLYVTSDSSGELFVIRGSALSPSSSTG